MATSTPASSPGMKRVAMRPLPQDESKKKKAKRKVAYKKGRTSGTAPIDVNDLSAGVRSQTNA